jgi:hypothetical protein
MITISPRSKRIFDDKSGIVSLIDHIPHIQDIRFSESRGWYKNTVIDLLEAANIDVNDCIFYTDHYLIFDDFSKLIIDGDNQVFVRYASKAVASLPDYVLPDTTVKKKLSFLSNKAREHRELCALIISNLFAIDDIFYTRMNRNTDIEIAMVSELLLHTNYMFDMKKNLPVRTLALDSSDSNSRILNQLLTFDDALKAATSVITEPCFFENGCILTEKTLIAIYMGHFIIWPGAWKIAETAKRIGLDVFEDYIDHSYQYLEHPGERVVEAFLRNKAFLDNVELQQEARNKCKDRLQSNLDLVRDIPRLTAAIQSLSTYVPV